MDETNAVPSIAEFGHVGVRCFDARRPGALHTSMLGLTVTDFDEDLQAWFLSARPDSEHHELLLTDGRDARREAKLIQQISFRCPSLADVQAYYRRFREAAVQIEITVSHGNAVGCYFYDRKATGARSTGRPG